VQDIGEKEKKLMKKTVKYTDEPIGDMKIIADFLPSPKDLIFKDDTVKITISLTKESVEFFKKEAEKHHTQYQKMIRNLLDVYANNHQVKAG
jgi:predicted DNA binding CopG/RHH family protein